MVCGKCTKNITLSLPNEKKLAKSSTHGISLDGRLSYVNDVQCWNKITFFFLVILESCFKPFSFNPYFSTFNGNRSLCFSMFSQYVSNCFEWSVYVYAYILLLAVGEFSRGYHSLKYLSKCILPIFIYHFRELSSYIVQNNKHHGRHIFRNIFQLVQYRNLNALKL